MYRALRRLALASVLLLPSCFPFSGGEQQLDGPYYLFATDVPEEMALYYRVSPEGGVKRIAATVVAVGWDEHHLIAQRHPDNDRSVTEYYILERAKDSALADPQASVLGPLTAEEFDSQREVLKVAPSVEFNYRVKAFE
jgi:hypothetical protein